MLTIREQREREREREEQESFRLAGGVKYLVISGYCKSSKDDLTPLCHF